MGAGDFFCDLHVWCTFTHRLGVAWLIYSDNMAATKQPKEMKGVTAAQSSVLLSLDKALVWMNKA